MEPPDIGNGVIPNRHVTRLEEEPVIAIEIDHGKSRMRLPGRAEFILDPEMEPDVSALQPKTAPPGEGRGLRSFRHAQKTDIELSAQVFRSSRNGKLHVIDAKHQPSSR